MNNKVFLVLKKELRETFRDKKSLSMMLIIPFMIPIIMIFMSFIFDTSINKEVDTYNSIGFTYSLSDKEKNIAKELNLDITQDNIENIKKKFENKEIYAYITKENNNYTIHYSTDDTSSSYALALCNTYLETYKEVLQSEYLITNNILPSDVLNIIEVKNEVEDKENFISKYIVSYAFLFIIMAITTSATYPATDATAGERERGTLETLLTFPIKNKDIIIGKYLSVSISSIITGILSLILADFSLFILPKMFEVYNNLNIALSPTTIIFSLFLIIAYSLLISGLSIAIASKSKSFKEAQSALTPLNFISFFPGMFAYFAEVKTTTLLSIVPFLNYSLLFTDIANKEYNWLNIILMFSSTIIFISIVLNIIIKQYKSEKVLFRS